MKSLIFLIEWLRPTLSLLYFSNADSI